MFRTFLRGWGQVFGPGIYRLTIVLGAANASPVEKAPEIKVTGTWPGVEPQAVSQILDRKDALISAPG